MNKLLTIALAVVLGLAGLLLGKVWLQNRNLDQANDQLNKELMQANLEIGRAHTQFGEAQSRIGDLEKQIQDEIRDRNARITRIGELEALLAAKGEGEGTVVVVAGDPIEIPADLHVQQGMLYQAVTDTSIVPVEGFDAHYEDFRLSILGALRPRPNKTNDIPIYFQYQLHLKIEGQIVETITPSGAVNNYITLWELDEQGKRINELRLTKFNMTVDDQRGPHFFWWAPHVDLAVSSSVSLLRKFRYGGSLGISFMGFGLTKNDLSWRFLRLSLEMPVQGSLGLGVSPVLYNIGDPIPLISNVWIGPNLVLTGDKAIGLVLGAVL